MKVLITGTSSGLGFGLALHYLENNCEVYGIGRSENRLLQQYENFHFISQDISHFAELEDNLKQLVKHLNALDLVILNAGVVNAIKDLKETSISEIQKVMDVNVWANKIIIDVLFDSLEKVDQVVAISSGAAVSGNRGMNAYALSKATLNLLINLYSKEQPQTHFCALSPGYINSKMQDYVCSFNEVDKFPVLKRLKSAKNSNQMPTPEKAAKTVAAVIQQLKTRPSGTYVNVTEFNVPV